MNTETPPTYRPGVLGGFVTDAETTGTDARRHGLLDVGIVDLSTGDEFVGSCRVHPDVEIDPAALAVNGATPERLQDPSLPSEGELITRIESWVREREAPALLSGQNPTFDRDFVQGARIRAGFPPEPLLFSRRTIDMHTLAVRYAIERQIPIPHKGFNTDEIYRLLDMPEEPKPHVGIVGARFEAVALCKLFGIDPPHLAAQREFVESFRKDPPTLEQALSLAEQCAGAQPLAVAR